VQSQKARTFWEQVGAYQRRELPMPSLCIFNDAFAELQPPNNCEFGSF